MIFFKEGENNLYGNRFGATVNYSIENGIIYISDFNDATSDFSESSKEVEIVTSLARDIANGKCKDIPAGNYNIFLCGQMILINPNTNKEELKGKINAAIGNAVRNEKNNPYWYPSVSDFDKCNPQHKENRQANDKETEERF